MASQLGEQRNVDVADVVAMLGSCCDEAHGMREEGLGLRGETLMSDY